MEFEPGKIVRGFFAARFVSAQSPDEAAANALDMVRDDLVSDGQPQAVQSAKLSVSEVTVIGLLAKFRGKNKGYTFYVGE